MRKNHSKIVCIKLVHLPYLMIKKFEETGSIMDIKLPMRHCTGQSLDNIASVIESVAESPGTSIHHRSEYLDIPRSTMQRILTKDLHLHAYKIQLTQELKLTDHVQRREFVNWVLGKPKSGWQFFEENHL